MQLFSEFLYYTWKDVISAGSWELHMGNRFVLSSNSSQLFSSNKKIRPRSSMQLQLHWELMLMLQFTCTWAIQIPSRLMGLNCDDNPERQNNKRFIVKQNKIIMPNNRFQWGIDSWDIISIFWALRDDGVVMKLASSQTFVCGCCVPNQMGEYGFWARPGKIAPVLSCGLVYMAVRRCHSLQSHILCEVGGLGRFTKVSRGPSLLSRINELVKQHHMEVWKCSWFMRCEAML